MKRYVPLVLAASLGGLIGYLSAIGGVGVAIKDAHDRRQDAEAATKRVVELAGEDLRACNQERKRLEAELERLQPKRVKGDPST